jgi:hypothetical protein
MLSEAKHLWLLRGDPQKTIDQRLKAWPRGLRPLRCSFAPLNLSVVIALFNEQ